MFAVHGFAEFGFAGGEPHLGFEGDAGGFCFLLGEFGGGGAFVDAGFEGFLGGLQGLG